MAKKQSKSRKRSVRKERRRQAPKNSENWKNQILVYILESHQPVTASQLQADIDVKQPIAFKILKSLEENGCVAIADEQEVAKVGKSGGLKRVWYKPTLYCLYFTCYREFITLVHQDGLKVDLGKITDDVFERISALKKIDKILDMWLEKDYMLDAINEIVDVNHLRNPLTSDIVRGAIKDHIRLYIKIQAAYENVKNDMTLEMKNFIGSSILNHTDPTHLDTIKRLSEHIIPLRDEAVAVEKAIKDFIESPYEKQ